MVAISDKAAGHGNLGGESNTIELDEQKDTVEGRIAGIVAKNSPLMQSARLRADQAANDRNIRNSTMALQAGEKAVIDSALPIAQQDAAQSYDAKKTIQQIQQQERSQKRLLGEEGQQARWLEAVKGVEARNTEVTRGQQARATEAQRGDIERGLLEAEGQVRERLANVQGDIDAELQELRTAGQLQSIDLEKQWQSVLQTSQSATVFYSEYMTQIGAILANENIPVQNKQALVNQAQNQLNNGLAVIGGIADLDLGELLNFEGATQATPIPQPADPAAINEWLSGDRTPESWSRLRNRSGWG